MNFTDETSDDLKALVELDFGSLPGNVLTDRLVLDWMHYRARLIPCRPRQVLVSPRLQAKSLCYPAVDQIRLAFEVGGEVSPWLSNSIRTHKRSPKSDLMFSDWQISHFHLGNIIEPGNRIRRTRDLLFAHVKADRVVFLDVQPHGSWTMEDLLRILHEVSPAELPELKGILPPRDSSLTDQERSNLRRNRYTTPVVMNGKVFAAPGLGQTTSHHAMRLSLRCTHLTKLLDQLRAALTKNQMPWQIQGQLVGSIGVPIRLGLKLDAGCLVIYEKMRGLEFATLRAFE